VGGGLPCFYYVVLLCVAGSCLCIHGKAFYTGNKSISSCVLLVILYAVLQLYPLRLFVELLSGPYYVLSSQYRTRVYY